MKKIILGISLLAVGLASAQKKEIQNAFKAIENGNTAVSNEEIVKAEGLINNRFHLLEPSVLEQYYYAKGLGLIKSGKTAEGAVFLGKIADLKTIYTGRDAEKNKVYFVGKAAADKSGVEGLKPEVYTAKTSNKVIEVVNPLLKSAGDEAYKAYQSKNFEKAAKKYEEVYHLQKAMGSEDKIYRYNAALAYAQAGKRAEAIEIYQDLIAQNYTGITTKYFATDVKTKQEQEFDKASYDLIKKMASKDYTNLRTEQTPSVELELYEMASGLLVEEARYDEALALIEKGLQKFSKSDRLSEYKGTAYYRSGRTAEFIQTLREQVAKNPNDKESWYNLGLLQSQDPATVLEAEKSFNKALEIDPNYTLALQGVIYSIYLKGDDKKVEEIRALQKAKKIDEMNVLIDKRRESFKKVLPYLEKWYKIEPKNIEVISTLKGIYIGLDREDKYEEFKKLEDSLRK